VIGNFEWLLSRTTISGAAWLIYIPDVTNLLPPNVGIMVAQTYFH